MKGLNILIRLHKRELDDLRKQFGQYEEQLVLLSGQHAKMQRDLAREEQAAGEEGMAAWGDVSSNYYEDIADKMHRLEEGIKVVERRMARLMDQMRELFGEVKKYEIARDNRLAAEVAALEKKIQASLDEIGLQLHQRAQQA